MLKMMKVSFVVALGSLLACVPVEEDQIEYERPRGAQDLVSDSELREFEDYGLVIYGGTTPPDPTGTYHRPDRYHKQHDNEAMVGGSHCETYWTIESTDDPTVYNTSVEYVSCDGEGSSQASYISGEGNCFTLYKTVYLPLNDCDREILSVISACVGEDGLSSPEGVHQVLSLEGETCAGMVANNSISGVGDRTMSASRSEFYARINVEE